MLMKMEALGYKVSGGLVIPTGSHSTWTAPPSMTMAVIFIAQATNTRWTCSISSTPAGGAAYLLQGAAGVTGWLHRAGSHHLMVGHLFRWPG